MPKKILEQLLLQARAMARHLLATGQTLPADIVVLLERDRDYLESSQGSVALVTIHERLSQLVAPALPRTLLLLDGPEPARFPTLGRVRLVRRMLIVAVVSMAMFVALSLSSAINDPALGNIFLSSGLPLLINEAFFLFAAALGASFSILFVLNRHVRRGTYDSVHDSAHWVRFILGLIAGLILATLVDFAAPTDGDSPFNQPLSLRFSAAGLALLGGFASSFVHRVLSRFVLALESLVANETQFEIDRRVTESRLRRDSEVVQNRLVLAQRLLGFRQQLTEAGAQQAVEALDQLLREVTGNSLPGDLVDEQPPPNEAGIDAPTMPQPNPV